ncbi:MAG: type II toxin-antitoxin system RelE/ParE family toxin [Candidatus Omnitrophica bacterium]|nr:type II toxin-antitoxin system RelE/ParE family toxin [Candidatus Omnitrophota bacterium]
MLIYKTREGKEPFIEWLFSLRDKIIRHRIEARIDRMRHGNYGDHKRFQGIIELRLDFGKGYRIYCGEDGNRLIILLIGGDKSSQEKDIGEALEYWRDYYE